MGKTRSIKGEIVDFDLLKVKRRMENRDKPDSVQMREEYIEIRRRRNPRRNVSDLVSEQRQNEAVAREKIQQSKENSKNEVGPEAVTVSEVIEGVQDENLDPTTTVTKSSTKGSTSKKIVKKTTKEGSDNV